jgi:hypothetical protein
MASHVGVSRECMLKKHHVGAILSEGPPGLVGHRDWRSRSAQDPSGFKPEGIVDKEGGETPLSRVVP